jgi:hypothetical protein
MVKNSCIIHMHQGMETMARKGGREITGHDILFIIILFNTALSNNDFSCTCIMISKDKKVSYTSVESDNVLFQIMFKYVFYLRYVV